MFPVKIVKDFTEIQKENKGGLNLTVVFEHVKLWSVKFTSLP